MNLLSLTSKQQESDKMNFLKNNTALLGVLVCNYPAVVNSARHAEFPHGNNNQYCFYESSNLGCFGYFVFGLGYFWQPYASRAMPWLHVWLEHQAEFLKLFGI